MNFKNQNKMKKNILTIILILLAIHLLYTNSILLMNFVEERSVIADALRILFAASYSIITVLIIRVYPVRYVFFISGILDGFSVAIKYMPVESNTLFLLSALYFGIYTMFIVIVAGEITKKNEAKTKPKGNQKENNERTEQEKKTIQINELRKEKRAIQNGINRMKNDTEISLKKTELKKIDLKLLELTT